MTPEDVDEIRAYWREQLEVRAWGWDRYAHDVETLADALEAAWRWHERDSAETQLQEAEAALAQYRQETEEARAEAARYADTLARVRALINVPDDELPTAAEIRAALGDQDA